MSKTFSAFAAATLGLSLLAAAPAQADHNGYAHDCFYKKVKVKAYHGYEYKLVLVCPKPKYQKYPSY